MWTNIYFFTLQRFGPSPSPNFKTKCMLFKRCKFCIIICILMFLFIKMFLCKFKSVFFSILIFFWTLDDIDYNQISRVTHKEWDFVDDCSEFMKIPSLGFFSCLNYIRMRRKIIDYCLYYLNDLFGTKLIILRSELKVATFWICMDATLFCMNSF